jgi:hypothetical protein
MSVGIPTMLGREASCARHTPRIPASELLRGVVSPQRPVLRSGPFGLPRHQKARCLVGIQVAFARDFGNRATPHNIVSDQAPISSTTRKRALPLIMRP